MFEKKIKGPWNKTVARNLSVITENLFLRLKMAQSIEMKPLEEFAKEVAIQVWEAAERYWSDVVDEANSEKSPSNFYTTTKTWIPCDEKGPLYYFDLNGEMHHRDKEVDEKLKKPIFSDGSEYPKGGF
jgi:hypothetical protein